MKTFLLNTGKAVNPFNRFSVAMATRCRLTERDVKSPFPWRAAEPCRNIKWFACVHVESEWADVCLHEGSLISALATQLCISSLPPMTWETVSKGRVCSWLIDMTLCSVKAIDSLAHVGIHTNAGVVPLVPPNNCSPHYLPAVCGCVWERGDMKREWSPAHSASPWMSWYEESQRKRERESWASSLCILLSHDSAHALPSTHIIATVMELFYLLPFLLVFSLSYSHALSPFFVCHASFRSLWLPLSRALFICHSWTLPSCFCHFFFFISVPPSHPRAVFPGRGTF